MDRDCLLLDAQPHPRPDEDASIEPVPRDAALALRLCQLVRHWTTATLRELSGGFGLSHPDSASDPIKRGKRLADSHRDVARKVASSIEPGRSVGSVPRPIYPAAGTTPGQTLAARGFGPFARPTLPSRRIDCRTLLGRVEW
jgi:hypothetical protein